MTDAAPFPVPDLPHETAPGLGQALVVLKPNKAGPPRGRHPWVFDTAVAREQGACADGDVVDVVSDTQRFIARGIINRRSRLRVRLYTWQYHEPLGETFWRSRIDRAVQWRSRLGYDDPVGAARLIFSEADDLSGLVLSLIHI